MEDPQYVHSLLPLINQEVDFVVFIISLPDPIPCHFPIFIQFVALREQAETIYHFPKAFYHVDRGFRRPQLKGDVVRLVCNVLFCQRQGNHLILYQHKTALNVPVRLCLSAQELS